MITHPDPEIEFLVHMLAGQRDVAMGQAATLFKENKSLKAFAELSLTYEVSNDV